MQTVAAMSEIHNTAGLSNHEIAALVTIMSESESPDAGYSVYLIRDKMGRSGYATEWLLVWLSRAFAVRTWSNASKLLTTTIGNHTQHVGCLPQVWADWLLDNQNRFKLRKNEPESNPTGPITDEDIPF